MTTTFEIEGNTLTVNVGNAIHNELFKSSLEDEICKYSAAHAKNLYEMNLVLLNMEYKNIPKEISIDEVPDDMTGSELKRVNQEAKLAQEMMNYLETLEIHYPNYNYIKIAIQRLYPELTDIDVNSIFSFVSDVYGYDSEFVKNVASATEFAIAIKKGEKLFS